MTSLPSLGPRGVGWVAIQGVLLVLIVAAGWSLGPDWTGAVRFVGIMAIAGGAILLVRGIVDLGSAFTPLPRPRDDAELVETGVYALARHPIYGGLILGALGWSVMQASFVALVATGVLAGFFFLKSAREEAWLEARFDRYAAYRRRTKRFIPWIG